MDIIVYIIHSVSIIVSVWCVGRSVFSVSSTYGRCLVCRTESAPCCVLSVNSHNIWVKYICSTLTRSSICCILYTMQPYMLYFKNRKVDVRIEFIIVTANC